MANLPACLDHWEPSAAQRGCLALVAERFGLLPGALVSRKRDARLIGPRFAAVWVLRAVWPQLTSSQLGKIMGGREHSTVLYALKRAAAMRAADRRYRRTTRRLASRVALAARQHRAVQLRGRMLVSPAERQAMAAQIQRERAHAALLRDIDEAVDLPARRGDPVKVQQLLDHRAERRLTAAEIVARREAREAEIAERQIAHLEVERQRYGLPSRGRALFEMVA